MITKIINSLKNINYKLFFALLIMGLAPTIYMTLRVFWLGSLPGEYSFSIAGQLSWVNLFYEIASEAIILPLFFFIGKVIKNREDVTNRIRTGIIISFSLYLVLSLVVIAFTRPLLNLMAVSPNIIEQSISYIRLEAIANVFGILSSFIMVSMVTLGKDKYVYFLTLVKLVLCVVLDIFFVSTLSVSLNLGVNGIAISNIIVNIILFGVTALVLLKEGINIFNKQKLDFSWMKDYIKIGGISGFESFVRNIFYMLMICRMVNVVGEQGTYWVANNFIWGWLLLPITQLGELIKQEVSTDRNKVKTNSIGYFTITLFICIIWIIAIPLYKPFMSNVLMFSDVDKLFELVLVLLGFYVLYAFQNVFDATFYGLGKTQYMLFESVVTNIIYYGICFVLYIANIFKPTLIGIALMFGIGNAFDSIVSYIAYRYLLNKKVYLKN